jgi:hypothetical protein
LLNDVLARAERRPAMKEAFELAVALGAVTAIAFAIALITLRRDR